MYLKTIMSVALATFFVSCSPSKIFHKNRSLASAKATENCVVQAFAAHYNISCDGTPVSNALNTGPWTVVSQVLSSAIRQMSTEGYSLKQCAGGSRESFICVFERPIQ